MKSHTERTLSLVYDADSFYRTPDEEIAAGIRKRVRRIAGSGGNLAAVHEALLEGMRICMKRHVVGSCYMCVKLCECKIHQMDIEIAMDGMESAIKEGEASRRKGTK